MLSYLFIIPGFFQNISTVYCNLYTVFHDLGRSVMPLLESKIMEVVLERSGGFVDCSRLRLLEVSQNSMHL